MIRITRSQPGPAALAAPAPLAQHEADYLASPSDYDSGAKKFKFDRKVYAHVDVKEALIAMQHGKCAFCEAKPLAVSSGDVEHFRPKGRVRSALGVDYPGYYWLAYAWENLLFACERCNRRGKRDEFPLQTSRPTPRNHLNGVAGESPMFIDPASEDPSPHIGFRKHMPVGHTPRGLTTIGGLGLSSLALATDREAHLNALFELFLIAEVLAVGVNTARARTRLSHELSDAAEYAAMKREAVRDWRAKVAAGQTPTAP